MHRVVKALIVADGDVSARDLDDPLLRSDDGSGRPLVIAADGGALKAESLGLVPDVVVGDLDSLSPETVDRLRAAGVEVQRHPAQKNESDTELAVREALRRGARQLFIVGALGGLRVDHSLANMLLLTLPELAECETVVRDGPASLRVIGGNRPARLELDGRRGDIVSLLPVGERVDGVTTSGLAFPLRDESLDGGFSRGLSNVMHEGRATISLRAGRLAVIHTTGGAPEADHA